MTRAEISKYNNYETGYNRGGNITKVTIYGYKENQIIPNGKRGRVVDQAT